MAVRRFATNNLVKDHDNYVKFMKTRWSHLSKEDKNTDILFYKKGLVTEAFGIKYSKEHRIDVTVQITNYVRTIKLWHSITIAYNIWYDYSRFYVDKDHSRITYKQFVDISEDVLKKFKFRFEQAVKNAKCEYKTNGGDHSVDPCRLLAMFWTYLDLVKDTKTQRYFPNNATIERAAKVFGYNKGDNPFKMNGTFIKRCVRDKKEEEKPVEEKSTDILDTLIESLGLSQRPYNLLKGRMYCNTLRDVVKIPYISFVNTKYIHKSTIQEIVDMLAKYGYEYKDIEKPATKIESVIDIAEQAAKEVEEERKSLEYDFATCKIIGKNDYEKLSKSSEMYDELNKKYEGLLKEREGLLTAKTGIENYCLRLKSEIDGLKSENEALKAQSSKLKVASNPKNLDTFTLLNIILEKMKDSKMEYILLTIDGMTIDIHPAKSFPIKSAYQIRSSER